MNIADFIFSLDYDINVCSGHYQTEIKDISFEDVKKMFYDIYRNEKNNNKLFLEFFDETTDEYERYSVTIYQKDYWEKGENGNFLDRALISFINIEYKNTFEEFKKELNTYLEQSKYLEYIIHD